MKSKDEIHSTNEMTTKMIYKRYFKAIILFILFGYSIDMTQGQRYKGGPKGPYPPPFHISLYCFRNTFCKPLCHCFLFTLHYDLYQLDLIYPMFCSLKYIFNMFPSESKVKGQPMSDLKEICVTFSIL